MGGVGGSEAVEGTLPKGGGTGTVSTLGGGGGTADSTPTPLVSSAPSIAVVEPSSKARNTCKQAGHLI